LKACSSSALIRASRLLVPYEDGASSRLTLSIPGGPYGSHLGRPRPPGRRCARPRAGVHVRPVRGIGSVFSGRGRARRCSTSGVAFGTARRGSGRRLRWAAGGRMAHELCGWPGGTRRAAAPCHRPAKFGRPIAAFQTCGHGLTSVSRRCLGQRRPRRKAGRGEPLLPTRPRRWPGGPASWPTDNCRQVTGHRLHRGVPSRAGCRPRQPSRRLMERPMPSQPP